MKIHFISIGGSVMHQLAIALKSKGYQVTGSDDEIFEPAAGNLKAEGLFPARFGWFEENITPDLDAVILGMHAKADNPEMLKAKQMGLKIYSFPEYIYEESRNKTRVAVGGSHGKTTTTSMIMHVLKKQQQKFDYLVGARLEGFERSVDITDAPVIICEADEYPASAIERRPKFHFLYPHIAIITGIAWDHINVFPTFENYLEQFVIFIHKIESGGIIIYNETDEQLRSLIEENKRTDIRYQPYSVPTHNIENGKTSITIQNANAAISVFGDHNLLNLNAAFYACAELGISPEQFVESIKDFKGASKRLELLASNSTTNVYRDFAHAPSKVKATIEAVKQQYPDRTLIAILELHTYSSLNADFMTEYEGAMEKADKAVVFYSNHALELKRMPPLRAEVVKKGFAKNDLVVLNDAESLSQYLNDQQYSNANLLLMSSGNYDNVDVISFAKHIASQ
jgi:UDP-N-acetylmuramate: L-alanyl-gamma-D-glutamyl-meso-diaminopimelate ligase